MKNITAAANWCCYYHNTRTVAQTVYFHLDGIMMHQVLFIFRSWDLRLGCLILKKECGVLFSDKTQKNFVHRTSNTCNSLQSVVSTFD